MKSLLAAILLCVPALAIGKDEPPAKGDIFDQIDAEYQRQVAISKANGTYVSPEVELQKFAASAKSKAANDAEPTPPPAPTPRPIMNVVLYDFIGPMLGIVAAFLIGVPLLVSVLCVLYIVPASLYLLARTIRRKIKEG